MDFFVVPTIGFDLLYAFVIVRLDRRDLIWINVTKHPTAEWVARQITEAFPWDGAPGYMIRDRDRIYGAVVTRRLRVMGIRDKPIAPASPWQKGFAERLIGSVRRECLDHIIVGTNAISDECPDTGCPKVAAAGTGTALASRGDAARCADDIQRSFAEHNFDVPLNKRIEMRIGVHAGDIIIDENDIFGDAVNIAVRLEEIAEPGGVCIYDDARRQVRGKIDIAFDDIGWQSLKNIRDAVRAWRVRPVQATGAGSDEYRAPQDKPFIAVLPFQNVSDDTKQEHLADGIVEEITTGLGRIRWLSVIARNSTLAYGGRTVDVRQIGRELGRGMCLRGACVRKGIEFG